MRDVLLKQREPGTGLRIGIQRCFRVGDIARKRTTDKQFVGVKTGFVQQLAGPGPEKEEDGTRILCGIIGIRRL